MAVGLLLLVGVLFFCRPALATLSDGAFGVFCALLAAPLCWVLFWRARVRRQAFRDFYLVPDSRWHRWIRGRIIMLGGRLAVALVFALLLLIGLARAESPVFWTALLMAALLWPSSYRITVQRVARQVSVRFQRLLATRLHLLAWFTIVILVLAAAAFFMPVPDVRGMSLEQAVWSFTLAEPARSRALDWGLLVTEALRALPHWLMQNIGAGLPGKSLTLIAWSLLLLREWLFAWPLMLLFQAAQDMLDGGFSDRLREAGLLQ